jgi:hypothetical protein
MGGGQLHLFACFWQFCHFQAKSIHRAFRHIQTLRDAEIWLSEIKLRAIRKIGELSAGLDKSQGGDPSLFHARDSGVASVPTKAEALEQAGLQMRTAQRYEAIAAIPEPEFVISRAFEPDRCQPLEAL